MHVLASRPEISLSTNEMNREMVLRAVGHQLLAFQVDTSGRVSFRGRDFEKADVKTPETLVAVLLVSTSASTHKNIAPCLAKAPTRVGTLARRGLLLFCCRFGPLSLNKLFTDQPKSFRLTVKQQLCGYQNKLSLWLVI